MVKKNASSPSPSSSNSTARASTFRDRLALVDLKRWEIYVSEDTKNQVRSIAKDEQLTAGIAAESLLVLGIESYINTKKANEAQDAMLAFQSAMADPTLRNTLIGTITGQPQSQAVSQSLQDSPSQTIGASLSQANPSISSHTFMDFISGASSSSMSGSNGSEGLGAVRSNLTMDCSKIFGPVIGPGTKMRSVDENEAILKASAPVRSSHLESDPFERKSLSTYSSRPAKEAVPERTDSNPMQSFFERAKNRKKS